MKALRGLAVKRFQTVIWNSAADHPDRTLRAGRDVAIQEVTNSYETVYPAARPNQNKSLILIILP